MADILIERFDIDVTSNGQTHALTHTLPSINSAFVRIVGSSDSAGGGPTSNIGDANPNDIGVGVQITSTTQLTFYTSNTTSKKISGEVWRYVGPANGDYEFITRQRGFITLTGAQSSNSSSISGATDRNSIVPLYTGFSTTIASVTEYEASTLACHINSSTDIVFSRNNTATVNDITAYYEAVEFTGSSWSVGHAISTAHDAVGLAGYNITMNTDSTGAGGSTFDVSDWGNAMILAGTMEGDSSETGLADCLIVFAPGSSTTQLNVGMGDNGAINDGDAYAHVIQCDDLIIDRGTSSNFAEGDGSYSLLTVPAGVNEAISTDMFALEWFCSTTGTGTAHARGRLLALIGAAANVADSGITYLQNDSVDSTDYDSSLDMFFESEITFAATPAGAIYECGGSGTGTYVGFNTAGDFVARAGSGGSLTPTNCARLVVTSGTYDFASKTGTLRVDIDVLGANIRVRFDEGTTGSYDFDDNNTAASSIGNWSGGDAGGVGFADSLVAGSEVVVPATFNGTITSLVFDQGLVSNKHDIITWVHRSGNNIRIAYGYIDMSELTTENRRIFIM